MDALDQQPWMVAGKQASASAPPAWPVPRRLQATFREGDAQDQRCALLLLQPQAGGPALETCALRAADQVTAQACTLAVPRSCLHSDGSMHEPVPGRQHGFWTVETAGNPEAHLWAHTAGATPLQHHTRGNPTAEPRRRPLVGGAGEIASQVCYVAVQQECPLTQCNSHCEPLAQHELPLTGQQRRATPPPHKSYSSRRLPPVND